MNGFTKEELEAIVVAIHNLRLYNENKDEFYLALHAKIGEMIDNYCEHELESFTTFRDMCTKCKGIF